MRPLFDHTKAGAGVGCLTYLVYDLSLLAIEIALTNYVYRTAQRAVLVRLYVQDAYDLGLRIARKGPALSDGRVLPEQWMWVIIGGTGVAAMSAFVVYTAAYKMLTGC